MLRYAVTGASGWLGMAAAAVLSRALGGDARARLTLFASRRRELDLGEGAPWVAEPLERLGETPHDVLLHYAYVTAEHAASMGVDAYVRVNAQISATVVDAIARQRPTAVVVASSGAVYGAGRELVRDIEESPYGVMKRLDELALRRAAHDAGARSLVLRVFNVSGAWLRKPDAFAIADLLAQAATGQAIRIRADRPVLRSYVDVEDLARVAVAFAADPTAGDDLVLDTAGERVVEMDDVARAARDVTGRPHLRIVRTWDPAAAPSAYVGDGEALHALARRLGVPLRDFRAQVATTAAWMGLARPTGYS